MAENSKIEWTDHTWNPWIGCQEVSAACDNCYARVLNERWGWVNGWGPHGGRKRTSASNWRKPYIWASKAMSRQRVFCASLADWLDNRVPREWREDLAKVIDDTPQLDWLLLTKRPENFDKLAPWSRAAIPKNVWIGITCEDQGTFDRRFEHVRHMNAVTFISYEPALGPIMLGDRYPGWVICGGESGAGAREMPPAWARLMRDQCADRGIPFFMKQMTGKKPIPPDLMIREFPREARHG